MFDYNAGGGGCSVLNSWLFIPACLFILSVFRRQKVVKKILLRLCYFIPIAVCIAIIFLINGATRIFFEFLAFVLFLIGVTGSTTAGFNGRTAIAAISGIAILISCLGLYHAWRLPSFIAGSVALIAVFITHNNKALPKLQTLYFIPVAMLISLLFRELPFSLDEITIVFLLFLLGAAWSTIAGFNSFIYPNDCVSAHPIAEQKWEMLKRTLKIALFIFVFATAGFYSEIFLAIAKHAHRNFTSTWVAPEPLGLENWINRATDGFAGGSGTEKDPFLISTPEQLAYLAKRVNAGTLATVHIKISNDIDLAGKEWTPIGTRQHPFSGILDGGDNVIYNLTIATSQDRQGLFGVVSRGTLENLTLVGVDIKGRDFVGGIAGAMGGAIRNSSLVGTIEGRNFVGGLSGYGFYHWISLSAFLGNVKGDVYVGGLIGKHTLNAGDSFLAFAHASARPPVELERYRVLAAVSGMKYVGGLVGHSGERTFIRDGFFAGKIRAKAFGAGISGLFPPRGWGIDRSFAFLYKMNGSAGFTEIAHGDHRRLGAAVLRHINGEWHFNSNPLPTEEAENRFFVLLEFLGLEQMLGRHRFTENVLERLSHPFYVLNIPYGMKISQDAPISIELAEKGFNPSLDFFLGGRFWVEDNHFNMSGSMRDIPRGIYAIPCSMDVDGRFETIWVLLAVANHHNALCIAKFQDCCP